MLAESWCVEAGIRLQEPACAGVVPERGIGASSWRNFPGHGIQTWSNKIKMRATDSVLGLGGFTSRGQAGIKEMPSIIQERAASSSGQQRAALTHISLVQTCRPHIEGPVRGLALLRAEKSTSGKRNRPAVHSWRREMLAIYGQRSEVR